MFSHVITYVFEHIVTRGGTYLKLILQLRGKFCPCICNSCTQCDKY